MQRRDRIPSGSKITKKRQNKGVRGAVVNSLIKVPLSRGPNQKIAAIKQLFLLFSYRRRVLLNLYFVVVVMLDNLTL